MAAMMYSTDMGTTLRPMGWNASGLLYHAPTSAMTACTISFGTTLYPAL